MSTFPRLLVMVAINLVPAFQASALPLADYIYEPAAAKVRDYRTCVNDRLDQLQMYDPALAAKIGGHIRKAFRIADDARSGGAGFAAFHGTASGAITLAVNQSRTEVLRTIQIEKIIDKEMVWLFPETADFVRAVPFKFHTASLH